MIPNSDQGIGIFFGAVGIGVLLWLAGRVGFVHISLMGFTFQRPRQRTADEIAFEREQARDAAAADRVEIETGFTRYAEAAVAMVPMVEARGPVNESLEVWFDVVAAAVAATLATRVRDHFRIAVWAEMGDPDAFRLLGCANLDRNDPKVQTLSKSNTIAGVAWRAKTGEYLCADITKDRRYKARTGVARPYVAIFAIRVGEPGNPWGVMTIDAPRTGAFGEVDRVVIRRFAKLISAGASVAIARYLPNAGLSSASLDVDVRRMIPRVGTMPQEGADE